MFKEFESHLEPEPVEDLYPGDDREAGEEAHHAAHPGDLVREGHPGTLGDLNRFSGVCLGSRLYVYVHVHTFVMMKSLGS